jgi:hypothetical protein
MFRFCVILESLQWNWHNYVNTIEIFQTEVKEQLNNLTLYNNEAEKYMKAAMLETYGVVIS